MIKEFYLVIDKDAKNRKKFPQGIKYMHLRNTLSHSGPLKNKTKQGLCENFSKDYFDLTAELAFDRSSSKNRQNVQTEAIELMKIALGHAQRQLQKQEPKQKQHP
jgi:hypothetical protein